MLLVLTVHSALVLLEPDVTAANLRSSFFSGAQTAMTMREEVSQATANMWALFLTRPVMSPVERISPIILPSVYQATAIYTRQNRISGDEESFKALDILKKTLSLIDGRWRAAGKWVCGLSDQLSS